jgi:hypothetical protein
MSKKDYFKLHAPACVDLIYTFVIPAETRSSDENLLTEAVFPALLKNDNLTKAGEKFAKFHKSHLSFWTKHELETLLWLKNKD